MTLRRLLFRTAVRFLESLVMAAPSFRKLNLDKVAKVDICTVAFNNLDLIKYQHRLLKKFVQDKFQYVIIDNSTDKDKSEAIFDFCRTKSIPYIKVPRNLLNYVGGVSYSHAAAVNYYYRRVLKFRKPQIFTIIDHDLFPIRPVSISGYLANQPFYGPLRKRGNGWYLSGVMSFFDYEWVKRNGKFDYMPAMVDGQYFDTGGSNWLSYYKYADTKSLVFPGEELEQFREGFDYHSDYIQYFDKRNWVHLINGSGWQTVTEGKDEWMTEFLENLGI